MKKRFKLITTLASITLALAMVVFGVYAASSASFTITSNVTYECNDVFVDVDVYYYLVAGSGTSLGGTPTHRGVTYSGSGDSKVPLEGVKLRGNTATAFAPAAHTPAFTASNKCAAIRIVLTNQNSNTDAKVKISALPLEVTNTSFTLTVGGDNYTTAGDYKTITKNGGTCEIVYKRLLTDNSKSVGSAQSTWSATITIENGAA